MPWYSSGTNYGPEIAMQGAAALTKLGQQMDERFDKLNQEGKASDAFFKANPEALDEMNIGEGQWKSMGAMQKSGILKGYLQSSGYKKAQAEQANTEALAQYHQQMTQHLQQEQQRTAAQPGFWSAFANADTNGPRLRDYYENPEKYNGPPAASLQDSIRAGMEAAPNAVDDRLGTALLHYGFGGAGKGNLGEWTFKPIPGTDYGVGEKPGYGPHIVPMRSAGDDSLPEAEPLVNEQNETFAHRVPIGRDKFGRLRFTTVRDPNQTPWYRDLTESQQIAARAEYNELVYAPRVGDTPEERAVNATKAKETIDAKYGKIAESNRAKLKAPAKAPGKTSAPAVIKSQADFDALPKGAEFINPANGEVRRKQ